MTPSQDIKDSFEESLKLPCSNSQETNTHKQLDAAPESHQTTKRSSNVVSTPFTEGQSLNNFSGFFTAGSKSEIRVSEDALNAARARLNSSPERNLLENGTAAVSPAFFPGFVTAGSNKVITVTPAALEAAQRCLNEISDPEVQLTGRVPNEENLDPSRNSATRANGVKRAANQPFTVKRPKRNQFSSPFRAPDMVKSPLPAGVSTVAATSGVSAVSTSSRITCIRELRSCKSISVDFLGIVVDGNAYSSHNGGVPRIKVADRYGECVSVEVHSSSIPSNMSRGSVISIEGALLRHQQDVISLTLTDTAFVDLEPSDPEADCLHRLFSTGLFDNLAEETFCFPNTSLRLIGRLKEYPGEVSSVMARITDINIDDAIYLGCTSCAQKVTPQLKGVVSCQHCGNNRARYLYNLDVELADFSGVTNVILSDDAAKKLIGRPAAALLKIGKEELQKKLNDLCFRPMLFRVILSNSKWMVDDCTQLDIAKFKPYLKDIAEQKGFKGAEY
ncbi:unnamed protein product [Cylicocyclus nassatus]|uniref:Replication factor A C-terminal domain-containing protein n=1 Tax=Cylicocyclus nassatus TaxID=53992 RepID=A0AA36GU44_CYLNA|nr:unnamed protein product [Cylicocyclus nassatus]